MNLPRLQRGFTLIEIMVVMTVIAILAGMVLYGLGKAQSSARDAQRQQIMTGIQAGLERYYGDCQYYPSTTYIGLTSGSAGTLNCASTSSLVQSGYLSSAPTDPGGSGATYTYTPSGCVGVACTGYVLTLVKESGGSNTFRNPQ